MKHLKTKQVILSTYKFHLIHRNISQIYTEKGEITLFTTIFSRSNYFLWSTEKLGSESLLQPTLLNSTRNNFPNGNDDFTAMKAHLIYPFLLVLHQIGCTMPHLHKCPFSTTILAASAEQRVKITEKKNRINNFM